MDYDYDYDQGQTSHWQDTTSLDSEEAYYNDYKDNSSEDQYNSKQRWFRWPWQKKEYEYSDDGWNSKERSCCKLEGRDRYNADS